MTENAIVDMATTEENISYDAVMTGQTRNPTLAGIQRNTTQTSDSMSDRNTNSTRRGGTNRFRGDTEALLSTVSKAFEGATPEISDV